MSRAQRGYALIVALLVATVVLSAGLLVAGALNHRFERLAEESRSIRLTALVDAGIARSLAELSRQPGWAGTGTPGESLGGGEVSVAVEPVAYRRVRLQVEARYRARTRRIEAEVRIDAGGRPRVVSYRPVAGEALPPPRPGGSPDS